MTESSDDSDEGTKVEKKQLFPLKESEKTSGLANTVSVSVKTRQSIKNSKTRKNIVFKDKGKTDQQILDQSAIAARTRSKLPRLPNNQSQDLQNYAEPPGMATAEPTISLETFNPSTSLHDGSSTDDPPILRQRKSVFPNLEYYLKQGYWKILVFQRRIPPSLLILQRHGTSW